MIYFIQDTATKNIKIGFTDGTGEARLATLQIGCPSKLILLLAIEGQKADESAWHKRFASAWERGEWFRPAPELLLAIAEERIKKLKAEKEELHHRLKAIQQRVTAVWAQMGSFAASLDGRNCLTALPPDASEIDRLKEKLEHERRSRKNAARVFRNFTDALKGL